MKEEQYNKAKDLREKIDSIERVILDYGSHDNAKIGVIWTTSYSVCNFLHTDLTKDISNEIINYLKSRLRDYKEEFINL